jgi:ankyrin repeat protein
MCWDGNLVAVQRLLDDGADANAVERNEVGYSGDLPPHSGLGRTPLQFACHQGHLEVARLLLNCGADKKKTDNGGCTPLHLACFRGHLELVRLLIDRGADKEKARNDGSTPLHLACFWGHLEVVRLLLDCGADNEAADKYGNTPLHDACDEGHIEIIKLLLQRGATPIQEDEEGDPMFPEESNALELLRKWHALTPARRNAVLRLGWDYIDVPTKWTTHNHSQFPADFRQQVAAIALAWQLPLVPFNRKPGDLVQQVAEETHAQMGLQG